MNKMELKGKMIVKGYEPLFSVQLIGSLDKWWKELNFFRIAIKTVIITKIELSFAILSHKITSIIHPAFQNEFYNYNDTDS